MHKLNFARFSIGLAGACWLLAGCSADSAGVDEQTSNVPQAADMATVGEQNPDAQVAEAAQDTLVGISFDDYADLYLDEHELVERNGAVIRKPAFDVAYKKVPDFKAISHIPDRKKAFFDYLTPAISYHNNLIRERRQILKGIELKMGEGSKLSRAQITFMQTMRERYRVPEDSSRAEAIALLLRRVDTLPVSMVLSQAAMESAWGTSRFAREANNLFGQWCFSKGCGLVPKQRNAGASHEVAKFPTVDIAIGAYFLNINSHPAYTLTRDIREDLRDEGEPLSGHDMVAGLEKYSARGTDYIDELRSMIRTNKLE